MRVTYVPQFVRDQIAQQVRDDLLQQPSTRSGTRRPAVRLAGSLPFLRRPAHPRRTGSVRQIERSEYYRFRHHQQRIAIRHDRDRRRRPESIPCTTAPASACAPAAGFDADIDDGITAEIRIATGNDGSPVTSNQTLGQNGPFTKYAIWLDRGFVKAAPVPWLTAYAGRMPNPFWTTDLIYYDDLGFDGFAASVTPRFDKQWSGFLTAGAFPVFNTAFNFGSTNLDGGFPSRNAWLFAVQAGGKWQATEDISTRLAAGYFDYSNISGKLSSPCTIVYSSDTCNTDASRTLFPGNGNTLLPIRDILQAPNNTQPQYFGLATPFHILDIHNQLNLDMFRPVGVSIDTDFAINLGFNRPRVDALGSNNFKANTSQPDAGNKAGMIRVNVGAPVIAARWDWNMSLAYKYIESDSVLASLNDPDFHLGGTNAKGFILAANLGIARNTWLTAKWFSSTQVSGQPYAVDVIQADLNVKF